MKNKICIGLLGMFMAFAMVFIKAAEQPIVAEQKTIKLESSDGERVPVNGQVAKLSIVVRNQLEDLPGTELISLPQITGKTLKNLLPLMELAYKVSKDLLKKQIKEIGAQLDDKLKGAELKSWLSLVKIVDYLDIEILKRPLADRMIHFIYLQQKGHKDKIENAISALPVSNEFKGLLAKCWYLKYSGPSVYILPDLNYGFSIEELVAYNKIHRIDKTTPHLDLVNLRISDLTGLDLIPGIESLRSLNLSNNLIVTLPENIFKSCGNLDSLFLANNRIKIVFDSTFNGLDKLDTLVLTNNQLDKLPENLLQGLGKLRSLDLAGKQLTTLPEKMLPVLIKLQRLNLGNNPLEPELKQYLKAQMGNNVTF